MKNDTKNRFSGLRQQEIILRGLPYGIYAEKLMRGNSESETRSIRKAYNTLVKKDIFERTPIENKGSLKRLKRDIFRNDRIDNVLQETLPDHLLKNISFNQAVSVRGNSYYGDEFCRLTRYADVQNFLYSCKVDTPLTVMVQHNANPFVFGIPEEIENTENAHPDLTSVISRAMYKTAKENDLPSVLDIGSVKCVFYANHLNETAKRAKTSDSKNIARSFNNSIGVLMDFANRCGYLVFKFHQTKGVTWYTRAYLNAMSGYHQVIREAEIQNLTFGTSFFNTAIVLCETKTEFNAVIKKMADLKSIGNYFVNILPIMMNESGMKELDALLSMGIDDYIASYDDEVLSLTTLDLHKSGAIFVGENGTIFYNGTYNNIKALNSIKKNQEELSDEEQNTFLVCYEDQARFYNEVIGIDYHLMLIIKEKKMTKNENGREESNQDMTIYELPGEVFLSEETRKTVTEIDKSETDKSCESTLNIELDSTDDVLHTLENLPDLY